MSKTNIKKLSSTAAPVVYGRSFSDIPYSKEIAELCKTDSVITEAYRTTNRLISPYIEARFKALTNLLAEGQGQKVTEDVIKNTGRNYHTNAFRDFDDAKKFFTNLGFDCFVHTLGETAGELTSIKIGLAEKSIENQLALNIWEFK